LQEFSIAVSIFHLTVKGLTTPWSRWVWRFVFLCAGAEHVVLRGPPSGSLPWFLTKGNTSPLATSSSPLRGTINASTDFLHQQRRFSSAFTMPSINRID
jgi:hypothetical protein